MNTFKNVLTCIGGLCVLLALGLCVLFFSQSGKPLAENNDTLRNDQEFRGLVINKFSHLDYNIIQPLLSEDYFSKYDQGNIKVALKNALVELGWIKNIDKLIRYNVFTDSSDGSVSAYVVYSLNFARGKGTIELELEKTNGKWLIRDFQIAKTFIE